MLFIYYPKCSTCRRAKAWLDDNNIRYEERLIVEDPPTAKELLAWSQKSNQPLTKFANASGHLYRSSGLAKRRLSLSDEEIAKELAHDGMLIKRPLLVIDDDHILTGFRQPEWEAALLK